MKTGNWADIKAAAIPLAVMMTAALMLMTSCRAQMPASQTACELISQNTSPLAVQAIQQDVSALALINRLSLTPAKSRQLLSIATRAREASGEFDARREQAGENLEALLRKQFDMMLRDQQPPVALMEQIAQGELELQRIDEQAQQAVTPFASEARKVLSEAQVLIITGEDEARQAAEEMLMWVRELSAEDFAVEAQSNAEALAIADIGLDTDTVLGIFRNARSLTAEKYVAEMDELAGKLAPLYQSGAGGEDVMIGRMLANDRFAPVLQLRMEYLSDRTDQG